MQAVRGDEERGVEYTKVFEHRSDEIDKVMRSKLEVLRIEIKLFIESLILAQDERWRRA